MDASSTTANLGQCGSVGHCLLRHRQCYRQQIGCTRPTTFDITTSGNAVTTGSNLLAGTGASVPLRQSIEGHDRRLDRSTATAAQNRERSPSTTPISQLPPPDKAPLTATILSPSPATCTITPTPASPLPAIPIRIGQRGHLRHRQRYANRRVQHSQSRQHRQLHRWAAIRQPIGNRQHRPVDFKYRQCLHRRLAAGSNLGLIGKPGHRFYREFLRRIYTDAWRRRQHHWPYQPKRNAQSFRPSAQQRNNLLDGRRQITPGI